MNPYAAAYIPLSKRGADDRTYLTAKDAKSINQANWLGNTENITQNQQHCQASLQCDAHGMAKQYNQEVFAMKSHPAHGSYGASSQHVNEVAERMMDEEFDMDLEFLQMNFPGISEQSLTDVYLVNKGDLGATVDMLSQLEVIFIHLYSWSCQIRYSSRNVFVGQMILCFIIVNNVLLRLILVVLSQ